MNPLRLRAANFRTFAILDLELRSGLHGILGELRDAPDGADSNGAGKSSILEALDICLFGRRSLAGFLTRGGDATELMLELTFEHAKNMYRVRRTFSAKGRGKTVCDFEKQIVYHADEGTSGYDWQPLTRSSAKETDQLIVETIGLTRDTFRNSSYLRQGDGSYADPARDPKQRKDLLVEAALGRDPVWPKLVDAAKTAKRAAQSQLERIAGETRAARELVDGRRDVEMDHLEGVAAEAEATASLEAASLKLQELVDRHAAAKEAAARRQTCEAELATVRAELERLQRLSVAAVDALSAIGVARDELETLTTLAGTDQLIERERELLAAIADHERALNAHRTAALQAVTAQNQREKALASAAEEEAHAQRLWAAMRELDQAPHDEARCDRCQQVLAGEARSLAIESMRGEANQHTEKTEAFKRAAETMTAVNVPPAPEGDPPVADLAGVRAQLAAAQQQSQQRARLEERIIGLQRDVDARPAQETIQAATAIVLAKVSELDDIEPVNLTTIEAAGAQARTEVARHREELDAAKTRRARLDERLDAILKAEAQLATAALQEAELQACIDIETVIERACGRDGIPALIIENRAIPYLEAEATRILGELGTGFRVELRTQAALKSGDGLRDTLEVVVIDPDGNEAEFADGTSGGEQTRIGLALRIALARLLANRRGAESRLLALDEPSYLDAAGMAALLQVLRGLQGEFDQILLVSHVPELRDSLDDAIVVVKDGGRSAVAASPTDVPTTAEVAVA